MQCESKNLEERRSSYRPWQDVSQNGRSNGIRDLGMAIRGNATVSENGNGITDRDEVGESRRGGIEELDIVAKRSCGGGM